MLYLKLSLCFLAAAIMYGASTTLLRIYWLGVAVYWLVNAILELIKNY